MTDEERAQAHRLLITLGAPTDEGRVTVVAACFALKRADERKKIAAWLRDGTERTMAAEILRQVADAIEELGR